ncbi:MAG: hypothetical protein R8K53_05730 [Mariprofundaceae bacterium]
MAEINRIANILGIDSELKDSYVSTNKSLLHLIVAMIYLTCVSALALALFFVPDVYQNIPADSLRVNFGPDSSFPQQNSRIVCGMAFLGAYVWGLQYIFRRYAMNDLYPAVYYSLGVRMVLATVTALIIFNAFEALSGGNNDGSGIMPSIWPALAFMIGMFPQRGLKWLSDRLPILSQDTSPSVRTMPIDIIEGVSIHNRLRLEELGIESCYDMANADFIPLILKTPFPAREVVDWIMQAKLCIFFGPEVKSLRDHGIRTAHDLMGLKKEDVEALAPDVTLTRSALLHARDSILRDKKELDRLLKASQLVSKFWKQPEKPRQQEKSA